MKIKFFSIIICFFVALSAFAQINMQNIKSVKVDQLSDVQVQEFIANYTKAGYSFAEIEEYAKGQGMPAAEIEKLRLRVQLSTTNSNLATSTNPNNNMESARHRVDLIAADEKEGQKEKIRESVRLFGADLFKNDRLTFEPDLNIATPKNYQVGSGDELIVDIFGFSENTMRLKVSPEGTIRIPYVGQIQVNGQTIENVEKIVKKQLSSVYSTINSGQTKVTVSLANIRSIKVYLVGEVENPGTYTLSSLATVFNALYACNGPSQNGSMRNIKVLRDSKEIATVDLYSFLINGKLENNITLRDQDVIQVPPYSNRVTVDGALKRNGIFEMKSRETLDDLISFAGGFTDDAYKARISVDRNTDTEKSVADIPQELYSMFYPQPGDKFHIGSILDKYMNRVQIGGGVFRPGAYALDAGMTLKDLINKADGLKEDAFMQRGTITRLQEDLTPEITAFNVKDVIDGTFNVLLKKEDIVNIGTKNDFEEDRKVHIYGQVLEPGSFPYYENMTLKDLIFMAKGFKEFAETDKIEVTRRIIDLNDPEGYKDDVEIITVSVDKDLNFSVDGGGDLLLEPRDQVSVRMIEGVESVQSMQILGEVRTPGSYAITSKKERISDILFRAGGFTQYAYPKGAFLIRTSTRSEAEKKRDLKLIQMLSNLAEGPEQDRIKDELSSRTDLVGIYLEKISKNPGSKSDLFVENNDVIFVPKQLQTVTVSGAVQVPGKVIYDGNSFKKYISEAGGFAKNSDSRHSYVAYSNGSISSTKKILFFKTYPKVEPGAHIFVPEKPEKDDNTKENVSFFVALLSSLVSMASMAVIAIDKLKQ